MVPNINDELIRRAEEIGDGALEFDPGTERDAYIGEACGPDETLKGLVSEYVVGGDAMVVEPVIQDPSPATFENKQIGPWKLLRRLGEGGFGVVYLAERHDGHVRQLGAIKFLKGTVHSRDLELRFLDERQILANLNHPWIVRLIDAGVSQEAQAYLVMDFVDDALPIDLYCSERGLSFKECLQLFSKVCEAVAYAHRKLIVHRDLKPSNILVAQDGSPRLLDFGVAKILDPTHRGSEQAASSTNVLVGTERYFSPEQARREAVDTATDTYSLGVILYQLLTGTDPYDLAARGKESIAQIICDADPELPSRAVARSSLAGTRQRDKLRRQLEGDLDNVLLMALRKEPQRRYASVDQFTADINRHLDGLPVIARRDTLGYRASKFMQRHKPGVAAGVLVVLSLLGGLTATIWQARRAQAAQVKAERRFNDVRKLASSYLFEFHDEIAKVPGTTAARALVVRRALEYLNSLAAEATGDRGLQLELATAYQKVGDAQGRPGFANTGDRSGALDSYRHALAIRKALAGGAPPDASLQRDLVTNYERIGDVLLITGRGAEALASYREAYAMLDASVVAGHFSSDQLAHDAQRDFATGAQRVAQALTQTGDLAGAKQLEYRTLTTFEELAKNRPADPIAQRDVFIADVKYGDVLAASGDKVSALSYYRRALPIAHSVELIAEDKARAGRETASVQDKIGNLLAASKDAAGALQNYKVALQVRATLAAADPNNAEMQRDLSISHEKIGNMLIRSGHATDALEQYKQSLNIDTRLSEGDPANAQARLDRAGSYGNIGKVLMSTGDLSGALEDEDHARALREYVAARDAKNVDVREDLAINYQELAKTDTLLGQKSGSAQYQRDACQWYGRELEVLRDLQQRGALDADSSEDMKTVTAEVAKCDQGKTGDLSAEAKKKPKSPFRNPASQ